MNSTIDLSIVVPVYNGSNYLFECLQSIKENRCENIEVVIVNDGSNDNHLTRKIVKRYFPEFKYIELISNAGVAHALNIGIENSTGTYIGWLSHDDRMKDNYVKETLNFIKNHKNEIFVHDYDLIDSFSKLTKKDIYKTAAGELGSSGNDINSLFLTGRLNGCTLVIRRDLFSKYGKFDQAKKYTQDYDYWSRLINKEIFTFTNKNLIDYRVHESNGTKDKEFEEEGVQLWNNLIQGDEFCELLKKPEYLNSFLFYLACSPFKESLTLLRNSKRYLLTDAQSVLINSDFQHNLILFKSNQKFKEKSSMDIFLLSIIYRFYAPLVYRKDLKTIIERLELTPFHIFILEVVIMSKKPFSRLFWKFIKMTSKSQAYSSATKVNDNSGPNQDQAILEHFFSIDYKSSFFSVKKYPDHKYLKYIKRRTFILKNMQLSGNYIILDKIGL